MRRRLIAAIAMPQPWGEPGPPPEVAGALRLLSEARSLDLQLLHPNYRILGGLSSMPGQIPLIALRLAAGWLRLPRASRPELVCGVGPVSSAVAVRVARVLGAASVVWTGSLVGELSPELMHRADDVWALDDRSAERAGRYGIRAFRAGLVPLASDIRLKPSGPKRLSICIALGDKQLPPTVLRGLKRSSRELKVLIIGTISTSRILDKNNIEVQCVAANDAEARAHAMRITQGVMVPDPQPANSWVVEALLRGRPLVVPVNHPPRCFSAQVGFSYDPFQAESVADALTELWVSTERRQLDVQTLRLHGERAAMEYVIPEWIVRTHKILEQQYRRK